MNSCETIRVAKVMEDSEAVLGTSDGNVLAHVVLESLAQASGTVRLDFTDIVTLSGSAACAFWRNLLEHSSSGIIQRLSFKGSNPSVLENLEYGAEFAMCQLDTPAKPSPA